MPNSTLLPEDSLERAPSPEGMVYIRQHEVREGVEGLERAPRVQKGLRKIDLSQLAEYTPSPAPIDSVVAIEPQPVEASYPEHSADYDEAAARDRINSIFDQGQTND